jgi:hypothetical protein
MNEMGDKIVYFMLKRCSEKIKMVKNAEFDKKTTRGFIQSLHVFALYI